jgi:hypothetical protein
MVAGLAYRERLRGSPERFAASLRAEPENPYNPCAIAVVAPGGKVGYVAPELARELYDRVAGGGEVSCVVQRGDFSPTTGILAILDV